MCLLNTYKQVHYEEQYDTNVHIVQNIVAASNNPAAGEYFDMYRIQHPEYNRLVSVLKIIHYRIALDMDGSVPKIYSLAAKTNVFRFEIVPVVVLVSYGTSRPNSLSCGFNLDIASASIFKILFYH